MHACYRRSVKGRELSAGKQFVSLLVQVKFDEDLVSEAVGDENFIARAQEWQASPEVIAKEKTSQRLEALRRLNKR